MENLPAFNEFLNEGITVTVEDGAENNKKAEEKTAKTFKIQPKVPAITISKLDATFEYNYSEVFITFSNGDSMTYTMYEARGPKPGNTVPPFYDVNLTINHEKLEDNFEWMGDYAQRDGTVVGAMLSYYTAWWTKNNS